MMISKGKLLNAIKILLWEKTSELCTSLKQIKMLLKYQVVKDFSTFMLYFILFALILRFFLNKTLKLQLKLHSSLVSEAEVESSRTSLASRTSSRTYFEVLGLGLGLEASSPWPWPRSLRSSKIAVLGSRTALSFEPLKFCRITPETSRKICKYLFYFAQLEHSLSQPGLPPN